MFACVCQGVCAGPGLAPWWWGLTDYTHYFSSFLQIAFLLHHDYCGCNAWSLRWCDVSTIHYKALITVIQAFFCVKKRKKIIHNLVFWLKIIAWGLHPVCRVCRLKKGWMFSLLLVKYVCWLFKVIYYNFMRFQLDGNLIEVILSIDQGTKAIFIMSFLHVENIHLKTKFRTYKVCYYLGRNKNHNSLYVMLQIWFCELNLWNSFSGQISVSWYVQECTCVCVFSNMTRYYLFSQHNENCLKIFEPLVLIFWVLLISGEASQTERVCSYTVAV